MPSMTGPAGSNAAPASATTDGNGGQQQSDGGGAGGGGGGGGGLDWMDILLVAGVLLVVASGMPTRGRAMTL